MSVAARVFATAVAGCVAILTLASPAVAAEARVVPGSTTLDDQTFLTYVPCAGFFGGGATAPGLRINRGPDAAPMGRRSFGLVMAGTGTAAGAVHQTVSMGRLGPVSMSVNPERATSGVAYVWYTSAALPAGQAWLGRADLSAAPGWQRVEVSAAAFSWQAYDLATRQPQGAPTTASVPDFVAAHGDGPGYVVAGFGCNGASFNLDALGYGASSYDLEGFAATTTIAVDQGPAGQPVTLRGWSERDPGRRLGDPLVLEQQVAGTSEWRPVTDPLFADPDAVVRTTVAPEVPTSYRWRMGDSEYADANISEPVLVGAVQSGQPGDGAQDDPTGDGAAKGDAQPNDAGPDNPSPDNASNDGATKGEATGDGQAKDGQGGGAAPDGSAGKDGQSKDGQSKDGQSKDGQSKDGQSKDGGGVAQAGVRKQ
ncbi:hypothetical protein [Nocardioides sp. LHG3406-4]|uniref:hypothetical protein n=1 Tax=Nocardioides sp. LHG3406-4 TaxID=2804575 RepID=UPI003CE7CFB2